MKIIFLGVSSALSVGHGNYHSNLIVKSDSGKSLLIDCGGDIRHSLFDLGIGVKDIDAVYISHLHADHVGGLEWLSLSNVFSLNRTIPLYISNDQVESLWNNVLSGGLSTLENQAATLESFFKVMDLSNYSFTWEGIYFELIQVEHTYNNSQLVPSYGLLITYANNKIFFTSDSRFSPQRFDEIYQKSSIIFHDCETSDKRSNQHSHYNDLKTLPSYIKNKIWLYDYNNGVLPNSFQDGFLGFVTRGQEFIF